MKKFLRIITFAIICVVISVFAVTVSAADIYEEALPFDKELLYGRSALAEMENGEELVAIYDTLFEGVQNGRTEISFYLLDALDGIKVTFSELYECVVFAFRYDNPQFFWWDFFPSYYTDNDGNITRVIVSYFEDVNTDKAKSEFKEAAEQFIVDAGIEEGMTEYEISLRLHDAVVNHIDYVLGADNDHNAYGALIGGEAVCEGYAELYQYLLYLCGIQSHAVTGKAGENHMWNLVKIDGEYYMSDPTWDDPVGNSMGTRYGYFNVTTERLLSEGRIINNNGYTLPECTATKANYANHTYYNGRAFNEEPSLQNAITQFKYYGVARFYYTGDGEYTLSDLSTWLNANGSSIAREIGGFSAKLSSCGNEFIIVAQGITTQDLPVIANVPKIAAICADTDITVKPNSVAGDVAICPVVLGVNLSLYNIQDLLNNTAVEVEDLVNGKIATGSKLIFDNEEAVIAVKGDIDCDGELSVFDANIAQKGDSNFTSGYELQKMASDIDENDVTDATDSQNIINQIVS